MREYVHLSYKKSVDMTEELKYHRCQNEQFMPEVQVGLPSFVCVARDIYDSRSDTTETQQFANTA